MIGRLLRQTVALLGIALAPALVQALAMHGAISWQGPPSSDEVSVAQSKEWGSSVLWIDARPADDFVEGHIPGALALNAEDWDQLLPGVLNRWSPEKKVVVYCSKQTCGASREVARRLRDEAGLKNVFVLSGGWEAWKSR